MTFTNTQITVNYSCYKCIPSLRHLLVGILKHVVVVVVPWMFVGRPFAAKIYHGRLCWIGFINLINDQLLLKLGKGHFRSLESLNFVLKIFVFGMRDSDFSQGVTAITSRIFIHIGNIAFIMAIVVDIIIIHV